MEEQTGISEGLSAVEVENGLAFEPTLPEESRGSAAEQIIPTEAAFFEEIEVKRTERAKQCEAEIAGLKNDQELHVYLQTHALEVSKDKGGSQRSQHLLKKLNLAMLFSYPSIMSPELGLQTKVAEFITQAGQTAVESIDTQKYKDYLKRKYPDLGLVESDWDEIVSKVSPEVFTSLDVPLERIVLLLNSLPGNGTEYSCSGHEDEVVYETGLMSTYFVLKKPEDRLFAAIEESVSLEPNGSVEYSFNSTDLQMYLQPPPDWLEAHGLDDLEDVLTKPNPKLDALLPSPFQYVYDAEKSKRENTVAYSNQLVACVPEDFSLADKFEIYTCAAIPDTVYREFYTSQDAITMRDLEIKKLEAGIRKYRDEIKS